VTVRVSVLNQAARSVVPDSRLQEIPALGLNWFCSPRTWAGTASGEEVGRSGIRTSEKDSPVSSKRSPLTPRVRVRLAGRAM
jgi:hypothetical protein